MTQGDPNDAMDRYNAGVQEASAGNMEKAVALWKEALDLNPSTFHQAALFHNLILALYKKFEKMPEGSQLSTQETDDFHIFESSTINLLQLCSQNSSKLLENGWSDTDIQKSLDLIQQTVYLVLRADEGFYIFPDDETINRLMVRGNNLQKESKLQEAIDIYLKALALIDIDKPSHKDIKIDCYFRIAYLSNDLRQYEQAVEYAKKLLACNLEENDTKYIMAKVIIEGRSSEKVPAKKEGCYIASAVYNSYDAPEVIILRNYRDQILTKSWVGLFFIKSYYIVSPFLVRTFKNNFALKKNLKVRLLDNIVKKCEKSIIT